MRNEECGLSDEVGGSGVGSRWSKRKPASSIIRTIELRLRRERDDRGICATNNFEAGSGMSPEAEMKSVE